MFCKLLCSRSYKFTGARTQTLGLDEFLDSHLSQLPTYPLGIPRITILRFLQIHDSLEVGTSIVVAPNIHESPVSWSNVAFCLIFEMDFMDQSTVW